MSSPRKRGSYNGSINFEFNSIVEAIAYFKKLAAQFQKKYGEPALKSAKQKVSGQGMRWELQSRTIAMGVFKPMHASDGVFEVAILYLRPQN